MQENLERILFKDFYTLKELEELLHINKSKMKKIIRSHKVYKEGYKKEEIIFKLMGNKRYEYYMLESYDDDFIPLFVG